MRELKVHRIIGLDESCNRVDNDYYLKSEADKVIAKKDAEIAELKMKLVGAKRNCKNCLQCHEIEDKGSFYKVFCKQVGHWIMWNKEDNCTEFLPKEVGEDCIYKMLRNLDTKEKL